MKQAYKYIICCFFFVGFLISSPTQAQTINIIQDINFGEAVVMDNSMQHEIVVDSNGSFSIDPAFSVVTNPSEGEYLVTGLPALQPIISVTVTIDQQLIGVGEDFIIDNFDIDAPAVSDNFGELPIRIGARLRTSGSGIPYQASTGFASSMTLTVNY